MSEHKRNGGSAVATPVLPIAQQNAVREQLDRILASSLFRHSKRFPDFLRYTVEQALIGDTEDIKERTLGIEVFGRDPLYDTNLDPVVRMTAVEVRKRITQYYQAPGREAEVRIDFSRGSYIPEFKFPEPAPPLSPAPISETPSTPDSASPAPKRPFVIYAFVAVVVLGVIGAGLWAGASRQTPLDRFWSPVLAASSPVTLCIPDLISTFHASSTPAAPDPTAAVIAQLPEFMRRDRVSFGDVMALSTMTGMFGSKGKGFRVLHTEDAKLDDLMQGPVVLIGGFSNQWTLQFGSELRYSFIRDGQLRYISDRKNPSSREWAASESDGELNKTVVDYALISRVIDSDTGRMLVTVAGIHHFGTEAAGRCVADPACLESAEKLTPGDWKNKNVQIVLQTSVIGGNPGQPRVLAAYLW
jgi:hypothetical protein